MVAAELYGILRTLVGNPMVGAYELISSWRGGKGDRVGWGRVGAKYAGMVPNTHRAGSPTGALLPARWNPNRA